MSDDILKDHLDYKPILKQIKGDKLEALKSDYSEFTLNYFKLLANKAEPVYDKLRLAMYCEYMIKFHLQPRLIKQKPEKLAQIMSGSLDKNIMDRMSFFVNHFLNTFAEIKPTQTGENHYNRNNTLELKLIYHILVVAMMLYDFKLNLIHLAKSLKLETKKLIQYCREIGCHVDEKKTKEEMFVIAKLKAPLTIRVDKFQKK
jgi:hypothetical protein